MKKFIKEAKLHPCRLNTSDLICLEQLLRNDNDIKTKRLEDFSVTSNLQNISISENSIKDFLNHENLPRILTRLSICIIGWSNDGNIDKSIDLTFYDNFITLNIRGDSETWVNGKFLQLTNFLKTKRPTFWFLKTTPVYMLRGALFVILFSGLVIIISRFFSGGFDSIGIIPPVMVFTVSIFDTVLSKFQYVKIYIKEEKSFIEKYNSLLIIIGAVGAIFTVIGVLLDIFK